MRYLPVPIFLIRAAVTAKPFTWRSPVSSTHDSRARGRLPLYVSFAAHGLVAALLVPVGMHMRPKIAPPAETYQIAMLEVAGGSAMAKLPFLMAPKGEKKGDKEQPESRLSVHPVQQKRHVAKASGSEAQAARPQDHGTSSAAGNGSDARNATFPFPVFSPKPPVTDRALLPSTDQQVVIDVNLNAAGEVVGENFVKRIGNGLDEIAMNIVKSWRFQPATVNGQAVASEAEVIFTFGPHYPTTDA